MNLLVSMGDSTDEGVCRIVAVDLARERAETLFRWVPPEPLRAPGKGFMGLAWGADPGILFACAHSALCRIDARSWRLDGVLHQPCMNDLHDVAVDDRGRLLVVNSGAERVEVFEADGTFSGGWDLAPAWVLSERMKGVNPSRASWQRALRPGWDTWPPSLDDEPFADDDALHATTGLSFCRRKTRDFVHPNHITLVDRRPVVTRFLDRSIQDLSDWTRVIPETPGYPHDGDAVGDRFWITCTSGIVVAYALEGGRITPREVERLDVPAISGRYGWCRGLVVTEELVVVSLTRVRKRANSRWLDRSVEDTETSILAFEHTSQRLAARVDLGGFGVYPKVFALLPTGTR